jgi:hypothetical protein
MITKESAKPQSLLCVQVHGSQSDYSEFALQHGRRHSSAEEAHARAILFQQHHAAIKKHNLQAGQPYKLALNKFADWSTAEYKALLGFKRTAKARKAIHALHSGSPGTSHRAVFR